MSFQAVVAKSVASAMARSWPHVKMRTNQNKAAVNRVSAFQRKQNKFGLVANFLKSVSFLR